ncbi:alpha/beta hydrolase [Streptomyces sp. NPDC057363]|uniref:alpha/beta hydrolase n=1 Tax=Streptomyces sp. NPDC057363 TaxID=3346107 RepID=UPI0036282BC4
MAEPHARLIDADGVTLSALVCEVPRPKAVLLALHGGGTSSTYFDCPGRPRLSLLRTAAHLGFTALALDRPGYGVSAEHADRFTDPEHHVDLAFAALESLLADRPRGAGVFVLAHSAGCGLALRMAADKRGHDFVGLELAGTGRHHQRTADSVFESTEREADARPARPRGLRALLWGPRHLYAPDVYVDPTIAARSPRYEYEARHWVQDFPGLAARVSVPVELSLGDHETVWRSGPDALADIAGLFTASPHVRVNEQTNAGHNLSLGLTARAYHLKVLSFVEECAVLREAGDQP